LPQQRRIEGWEKMRKKGKEREGFEEKSGKKGKKRKK